MANTKLNRKTAAVSAIACSLAFTTFFVWHRLLSGSICLSPQAAESSLNLPPYDELEVIPDRLHPYSSLNGPPTPLFRDNLRDDTKYITNWGASAGWTNEVISAMNLIYLGMLTERVPILPMFLTTHLTGKVPSLMFSEVFDLPRLRKDLNMPILEWQEVKQRNSTELETLGCWSVWKTVSSSKDARYSDAVPRLKLDISYTKAPWWIKMMPNEPRNFYSTYSSLAALAFPTRRNQALLDPGRIPAPSPSKQVALPPDDHMVCYDYVFYTCAIEDSDWKHDYSPTWRSVGRHMHWAPSISNFADDALRRAFALAPGAAIPPFIAIHARHGDFKNYCKSDNPLKDCFPSLESLADHVGELQTELRDVKNIEATRIIIMSDETDQGWWGDVAKMGWLTVDHAMSEAAEAQYGVWYEALVDSVVISKASGLVGTEGSTFSMIGGRRIQDWQGGLPMKVAKLNRS